VWASLLWCIYHSGLLSYVCASLLLCIYLLGPLFYVCASSSLCIYLLGPLFLHVSSFVFICASIFLMIRAFCYCASYSLLLRIHLSFNQGLFARPFLLLLRIHLFTSRALNHLLAFVPFFLCSFSILASARMRFYFSSSIHIPSIICAFAQPFSLMYL